jgi:UDP-GlcNAc:undecaprenyl-phosphate GlcNAc-1-phosphate transferase
LGCAGYLKVDKHFFLFLTAFLSTVVLIRLFRRLASHVALIDVPAGRKSHEGSVPLVGGIAIITAFLFTAFLTRLPLAGFNSLFSGLLLLVVIGLLDDLHDLSTRSRFFAQIMASLVMASWGGVMVNDLGALLGNDILRLNNWAIPFTVIGVIGVINAMNMIDGVDGLAGGITLIALVLFGFAAQFSGLIVHATLLFTLAAAVLGFLVFNFRAPWMKQALVFMGDAGSMTLGFALAWFAVDLTSADRLALAPITAVWVLAVPLLDMASVMLRRVERGISPFTGDAQHLHHLLLRHGFSTPKTVTLMLSASLVCGVAGLASLYYAVPESVMFYSFLLLLLIYHAVMRRTWKNLGQVDPAGGIKTSGP